MEGSKFKCPFCGKPFIPTSVQHAGTCLNCGVVVDFIKYEATILDNAPHYLKESQRFLELFADTDPQFVLSKHDLFTEEFSVDDCLFLGCKYIHKDCNTVKPGKMLHSIVLQNMKLIAGKRMLTATLLSHFKQGIANNVNDNPIVVDKPVPAKRHLWLYMLLSSVEEKYSQDIEDVTNLYFDMTLEAKLQRLLKPFPMCTPVTPEQAMLSFILNNPEINIAWGVGANNLKEKIHAYIYACMNDIQKMHIKTIPVNKFKYADPDCVDALLVEEIKRLHLMSMPSTAVNITEGEEVYKFDILNHVIQDNPFEGYAPDQLTNATVIHIYNVYMILSTLVRKHLGFSRELGVKYKTQFLFDTFGEPCDLSMSPDQLLVTFWQRMFKYYRKVFGK